MSTSMFRSTLATRMDDFVAFKRLQGYDYTAQAEQLTYFDRFLAREDWRKPHLTDAIASAYVKHTEYLAPNSRCGRLSVVRVFSRRLHLFVSESYVLEQSPVKHPTLPRFYLYEDADVRALMQAALKLRSTSSLRPHTHHTLIGLLAATGLRISEALSLDLADARLEEELLFVRNGKFAKERLLPLHSSTVSALQTYRRHRLAFGLTAATDPLFINTAGPRLSYHAAADTFRRLRQRCAIAPDAKRPPRLHDFRHSYATRCLLKWYREGRDVNAMLPLLATYMGHVSIESTQIYLHMSSQLLAHAGSRFEDNCSLHVQ